MERDILFTDITRPEQRFRLQENLRELYQLLDPRFVEIDYGTTITIDADEGDVFLVELTGNVSTITIKNAYKGRKITIIFLQDSTGSRTVAGWGSDVMIAGNAFTATATASRYSSLTFVYDSKSKWVEIARTQDVY